MSVGRLRVKTCHNTGISFIPTITYTFLQYCILLFCRCLFSIFCFFVCISLFFIVYSVEFQSFVELSVYLYRPTTVGVLSFSSSSIMVIWWIKKEKIVTQEIRAGKILTILSFICIICLNTLISNDVQIILSKLSK